MPGENVETVRALYEAWNGRDGRNAALAFIHEDFEWVNPSYALESGTRRGHAGWCQAMDSLDAAFHHLEHRLMEARDLGDRVLCFTTFVARTSVDGIGFEQDESHLWTVRDGKAVRLEWFHDRREALQAAGRRE